MSEGPLSQEKLLKLFNLLSWHLASSNVGSQSCTAPDLFSPTKQSVGYYNSNQCMGLYELLQLPSSKISTAQDFPEKAQKGLSLASFLCYFSKRPRAGLWRGNRPRGCGLVTAGGKLPQSALRVESGPWGLETEGETGAPGPREKTLFLPKLLQARGFRFRVPRLGGAVDASPCPWRTAAFPKSSLNTASMFWATA